MLKQFLEEKILALQEELRGVKDQLYLKSDTIHLLKAKVSNLSRTDKDESVFNENTMNKTIVDAEKQIQEQKEENFGQKRNLSELMDLHKSVMNTQTPGLLEKNQSPYYWIGQQAKMIEELIKNNSNNPLSDYNTTINKNKASHYDTITSDYTLILDNREPTNLLKQNFAKLETRELQFDYYDKYMQNSSNDDFKTNYNRVSTISALGLLNNRKDIKKPHTFILNDSEIDSSINFQNQQNKPNTMFNSKSSLLLKSKTTIGEENPRIKRNRLVSDILLSSCDRSKNNKAHLLNSQMSRSMSRSFVDLKTNRVQRYGPTLPDFSREEQKKSIEEEKNLSAVDISEIHRANSIISSKKVTPHKHCKSSQIFPNTKILDKNVTACIEISSLARSINKLYELDVPFEDDEQPNIQKHQSLMTDIGNYRSLNFPSNIQDSTTVLDKPEYDYVQQSSEQVITNKDIEKNKFSNLDTGGLNLFNAPQSYPSVVSNFQKARIASSSVDNLHNTWNRQQINIGKKEGQVSDLNRGRNMSAHMKNLGASYTNGLNKAAMLGQRDNALGNEMKQPKKNRVYGQNVEKKKKELQFYNQFFDKTSPYHPNFCKDILGECVTKNKKTRNDKN